MAFTLASEMRLRGSLDVEALRVAFQHAVDAQEVLRTTFHERDGHPVQVIGATPKTDIPIVELEGSKDLVADWVGNKCGNFNVKTQKCG